MMQKSTSHRPSSKKSANKKGITPKGMAFAAQITAAVIVVIGLLGGGYYYFFYLNGPCGKAKVENSIARLQTLLVRWIDEDQAASKAARADLPGHVTNLKQMKAEAESLVVPGCLADSSGEMVKAMDASLQGYQLFIDQASDTEMNNQFQKANDLFLSFSNKVNQVKACAPYCPEPPRP